GVFEKIVLVPTALHVMLWQFSAMSFNAYAKDCTHSPHLRIGIHSKPNVSTMRSRGVCSPVGRWVGSNVMLQDDCRTSRTRFHKGRSGQNRSQAQEAFSLGSKTASNRPTQ